MGAEITEEMVPRVKKRVPGWAGVGVVKVSMDTVGVVLNDTGVGSKGEDKGVESVK